MAAGLFEHPRGVFDGADVAVADDGDPLDRLDDLADAWSLHEAAEALLARPAVDRDRGHADLLELAGEERSGDLRVVPAEPHLDRDGDPDGLDDRLDERRAWHPSGTSSPSPRRRP